MISGPRGGDGALARAVSMALAAALFAAGLKAVAGAASAALLAAGLLWALDVFSPLPDPLRAAVWIAALAAALAAGLRSAGPWPRRSSVARRMAPDGGPQDAVLTALELASWDPSNPFVDRTLGAVSPAIGRGFLSRAMPPHLPRWTAAAFLALAGWAGGILASADFRASLRPVPEPVLKELASLRPGDAAFARGGTVDIEVRLSPGTTHMPRLWVRGPRGRWSRRPWAEVGENRYALRLIGLRETTRYRLTIGGRRGRTHVLTPMDPPRLVRLAVEARPGGAAENPFAPEVLPGAELRVSGRWGEDDVAATFQTPDGAWTRAETKGREFQWVWRSARPGPMTLWAGRGDSAPLRVADFSVGRRTDSSGEIRWRSPEADAVLAPGVPTAVEFEAFREGGVGVVSMEWRARGRAWRRSELLDAGRALFVSTRAAWSAPKEAVGNGRIEARLAGRGPSGGSAALSEARTFLVENTSATLARLSAALDQWRSGFGEHAAAQDRLVQAATDPAADGPALSRRQEDVARRLESDAADLAALVEGFARHGLPESPVVEEHAAIADRLAELSGEPSRKSAEALRTGDASEAQRLSDALGRLAAFSDRARRVEAWRGLDDDHSALRSEAVEMIAALDERGVSDPESRAALAAALDRLEGRLRDLARRWGATEGGTAARGVPLRYDAVGRAWSALRAAMSRGDAAAAIAAAREALSALDEIESAIAAARGEEGNPALSAAVEDLRRRMTALIELQESIEQGARSLSERRRAARTTDLERTLSSLPAAAARWREATQRVERAWRVREDRRAALSAALVARVRISEMERALASGTPAAVPARLEEALRALDAALSEDRAAASAQSGGEKDYNGAADLEAARAEAAEFADRLSPAAEEAAPTPLEELAAWERLSRGESLWAGSARDAAQRWRSVSSISARIPPEGAVLVEEAAVSAEEGARGLAGSRPEAARESLRTALEKARAARDALDRASRGRGAGGGSGSPGASGTLGVGGHGPVDVPAPTDPRVFREELSESMKESYPRSHERAVQDYFRHWTK